MAILKKQKKAQIDALAIADDLIELDRLKGKLAYYKDKEMEQRVKCAEYLTKGKSTGTYSYSIPGFKVSVKKSQNISLDWRGLIESDGYAFFEEQEQECIRFKPELVESKFKLFSPDSLPNLSEYITIKPAAPEVKLTRIADEEPEA